MGSIINSSNRIAVFRAIFDLSKKIALSILLLKLGVSVKRQVHESKFMDPKFEKVWKECFLSLSVKKAKV